MPRGMTGGESGWAAPRRWRRLPDAVFAVVARSRSAPEEACERDVGCWSDGEPPRPVVVLCCLCFFESGCLVGLPSVPVEGRSRVEVEADRVS